MVIEKTNKFLTDSKADLTDVDALILRAINRNTDIAGIRDASGLVDDIILVDSSLYIKKDATSSNATNWIEWPVFEASVGS